MAVSAIPESYHEVFDLLDAGYAAVYNDGDYSDVDAAIEAAHATDIPSLIEAAKELEIFAYGEEDSSEDNSEDNSKDTVDTDKEVSASLLFARRAIMEAYFAIDRRDKTSDSYVTAAVEAAHESNSPSLIQEAETLVLFADKRGVFKLTFGEDDCVQEDAHDSAEFHCEGCGEFHYACACQDIEEYKRALEEEEDHLLDDMHNGRLACH